MADDDTQRVEDQDAPDTDNTDSDETVEPTVTTDDDKVSKADYDKLFARMQAADKAKSAAEKALSDKNKAEMSELERTKTELDEAKQLATKLASDVDKLRIENAFFQNNKYTWHDPSDAIAALDMSTVSIGEDGKVEGLTAAIADVAKRKPHFVKKDDKSDPPPVATGDPANGNRKGTKVESADRAALAKRFPALNK